MTVAGLCAAGDTVMSRNVIVGAEKSLTDALTSAPYDAIILPGGAKGSEAFVEVYTNNQILYFHSSFYDPKKGLHKNEGINKSLVCHNWGNFEGTRKSRPTNCCHLCRYLLLQKSSDLFFLHSLQSRNLDHVMVSFFLVR